MYPLGVMPRKAPRTRIPQEDKAILLTRASSRTLPKQTVDRAKMILDSEAGKPVKLIAQELNTYPNKIIYWRQRYVEKGLEGLNDTPRSGRPAIYGKAFRNSVLELLKRPPPKGLAAWDGPELAKELNVPVDAIWKVLRREGINLQRRRSWCISTDKNFASKAADIVGLYLDPPLNAIVLCVDEKPSIQALERKTGFIKTNSGKVVRAYKSTYKRHGTLNLFAALEVSTGKIQGKVTKEKKRIDFQDFMDGIVAEYSPDQELHVILDNYSTHKKNEEWLTRNRNVHFHFTPTSASWLNQVEIWFGIFSRKALRGASFTSPQELRQRIEDFIERYNPDSKPFKWRKREVKGAQIKDTIDNLIN
jgi:transposase